MTRSTTGRTEALHPDAGHPDLPAARYRAGRPEDLDLLLEIDREACTLFEQAGLTLDVPEPNAFSERECARFAASLAAGGTIIAIDARGEGVGFIGVGLIDARPYVEQLSVRPAFMRRGIGASLLDRAFRWSRVYGAHPLWLTTYDHLPWNRPFYERHGYAVVPEKECEPELRKELQFQRRWLPRPDQRVAMRTVAR